MLNSSKCFTYIISCDASNKPMMQALLFSHFKNDHTEAWTGKIT